MHSCVCENGTTTLGKGLAVFVVFFLIIDFRASLVAQWLRICLPVTTEPAL